MTVKNKCYMGKDKCPYLTKKLWKDRSVIYYCLNMSVHLKYVDTCGEKWYKESNK